MYRLHDMHALEAHMPLIMVAKCSASAYMFGTFLFRMVTFIFELEQYIQKRRIGFDIGVFSFLVHEN